MLKWVMRLHMYGGLFFFGFLMVFALSALCFNHNPAFLENGRTSIHWEQSVVAPPQADPWLYAAAVEDEVAVTGRVLHPAVSKAGDLDFEVARPGRRYKIHLSGGHASIDETREGWAATLVGMHGVRPTNNAAFLNAWAWYSAIGALVLVGSAITGVFIWAIRPRERVLGWTLLAGATAVSLAICFYIRARG